MGRNQMKGFPQTALLSSAKACISVFPDLFMDFCSEQPCLGMGRTRSVFSPQVSSWVDFALRKREGKKQKNKARRCHFFFLSGIKPDAANLPLIKQYFAFRKRQLNCTEQYETLVLPEVAEFTCSEHEYLFNAANRRSHTTIQALAADSGLKWRRRSTTDPVQPNPADKLELQFAVQNLVMVWVGGHVWEAQSDFFIKSLVHSGKLPEVLCIPFSPRLQIFAWTETSSWKQPLHSCVLYVWHLLDSLEETLFLPNHNWWKETTFHHCS